jgi:hypothetical protein
MERGKKKISATALEEKVREKAYWRLMEWEAAQPEDDGDIIDYLEKLGSFTNNDSDTTEKIVKVFAGGMGAAEIKKLSVSKVFAMLRACYTEIFDMPSFSRVAGQKGVIGNLFDIPAAALKQMYREEIRALLPPGKPAAEGSPKKPGKKRKEKQSGGEAPGPRGEENGPDDDDLAIPF